MTRRTIDPRVRFVYLFDLEDTIISFLRAARLASPVLGQARSSLKVTQLIVFSTWPLVKVKPVVGQGNIS